MSDVLAFTVPTFYGGTRYPSVNAMWASAVRYGQKTPEYVDLFRAVRLAAWEAMKATGWTTATDRVEVHLRRYVTTQRRVDAGNQGKAELDAMGPWKAGQDVPGFPGVYDDDYRVRPFLDVTYDPTPEAVDRIAIAVVRLFTAPGAAPRRVPRSRPKRIVAPVLAAPRPLPVDEGPLPTLNGRPISRETALELIRGERVVR